MQQGFVTISDHRYFPGVRALVNSIRANSPAPVTVIDEGLSGQQRAWLALNGVETRRVKRSIPMDDSRFGCCYALFDIDAAPYERIICIDPDAVVLEDVRALFTLLDNNAIAVTSANAFRTLINAEYRRKLKHAFPRPRARFLLRHPHNLFRLYSRRHAALQSGVVAVRRELLPRLRSAAMRYADFFDRFALPDQDLLSLSVADLDVSVAHLPFPLNAPMLHALPESVVADARLRRKYAWVSEHVEMAFHGDKLDICTSLASGSVMRRRIRVLHYAGPDKPWKSDAMLRPGFREIWQRYHDGVEAQNNGFPRPA